MLQFADPGGRGYTAAGTTNANILAWWSNGTTTSNLVVSAGNGRTTGSCLRMANASTVFLYKSLSTQTTWGIAFAFRPAAYAAWIICSLRDNVQGSQVDLRLNAIGALEVTRAGTLLGRSSIALALNTWCHIEWKTLIDDVTGTTEVRVNGVAVLGPLSSLDTKATANTGASIIIFGYDSGNSAPGGTMDFDDIIAYDGQTTDAAGNSDIHDFIGDCGVSVLRPSGAGTTTQFTPDTGSNYARVQEGTPDTTSYVESTTIGNKDTYAMDDLAGTVTSVKSILTAHYAEKTDVGARQMGSVIRTNSTNYTHATGIDLNNSYAYLFRNWGSNPNTTSAWSTSNINALEVGQVVNT